MIFLFKFFEGGKAIILPSDVCDKVNLCNSDRGQVTEAGK